MKVMDFDHNTHPFNSVLHCIVSFIDEVDNFEVHRIPHCKTKLISTNHYMKLMGITQFFLALGLCATIESTAHLDPNEQVSFGQRHFSKVDLYGFNHKPFPLLVLLCTWSGLGNIEIGEDTLEPFQDMSVKYLVMFLGSIVSMVVILESHILFRKF